MYTIEQFHDYKMVENRSVLEQAHEIQCIAKEVELLKCVLPGKFVAGCIIAKLPNSWRNFATTLKHQRREFSVEDVTLVQNDTSDTPLWQRQELGDGKSRHPPRARTGP